MYYRALRANPNLADAYNNLGIDLAERGEVYAAIPMFQQAIRLRPNLDRAYYNLGVAYLRQGKAKEAREMFETALQKNPANAGARERLDSLREHGEDGRQETGRPGILAFPSPVPGPPLINPFPKSEKIARTYQKMAAGPAGPEAGGSE